MLPDLEVLFPERVTKSRVPCVPHVHSLEDQALAQRAIGHNCTAEEITNSVPCVQQPSAIRAIGRAGHDGILQIPPTRVPLEANVGAGFRETGHEGHTGHEGKSHTDNETPPRSEAVSTLDYSLLDLREFDRLIEVYVELALPDVKQRNLKRLELLAARRRMAPARVKQELAEFRGMVAELRNRVSSTSATSEAR